MPTATPEAETSLTLVQETTALSNYESLQNEILIAKQEARAAVFDYNTPQGNKAARSYVFRLRKLKAKIDKKRKEAGAELLVIKKRIDDSAKLLEKEVVALIAPHQEAIDAIERAEAERVSKIEGYIHDIVICRDFNGAINDSAEIRTHLETIEALEIDPEVFAEYTPKADTERTLTLNHLRQELNVAETREAEAAELARLREEARQREQREREARIAEEARQAEAARLEAEAEAERKRLEAKAKEREAEILREAEEREAEILREAEEREQALLAEAAEREAALKEELEERESQLVDAVCTLENLQSTVNEVKNEAERVGEVIHKSGSVVELDPARARKRIEIKRELRKKIRQNTYTTVYNAVLEQLQDSSTHEEAAENLTDSILEGTLAFGVNVDWELIFASAETEPALDPQPA